MKHLLLALLYVAGALLFVAVTIKVLDASIERKNHWRTEDPRADVRFANRGGKS